MNLHFAISTFLVTVNSFHGVDGKIPQNDETRVFISNRQRRSLQTKIVGGQAAGFEEFPYYAQWWGNTGIFEIGSCGATLIHADIILTAAHCNEIDSNVQVVVGAYYYESHEQGDLRTVTNRSIHPNYDPYTNFNDFLVMKLDSGVPTRAVLLNSYPAIPVVNQMLTTIGLGDTTEGGQTSSTLQKVNVKYVAPNICQADYNASRTLNATVQLCAGVPKGGKDSCQGDSGGPILTSTGVHVGVVSTGNGCARVNFPGIYARTSGAIAWIKKQVCAMSDYPPSYCYKTALKATKVRLDVFYDMYSNETSYKVYSSSSKVVDSSKRGKDNSLVSRTLSLTPGYYYWGFSDTAEDGFCCSDGIGFIAAFAVVNGLYVQILAPIYGEFNGTSSANVPMPVPKGNTGTINSTSGSGTTVMVEVYFDKHPTETSFTIYDSDDQVVGSSGLAVESNAKTSKYYTFVLDPGSYTVQFVDKVFGNGFCCEYGIGYYAVYAVVKGAYQALVKPTYAAFKTTKNVVITVPSKGRSSKAKKTLSLPPPPPSILASDVCRDDPSLFSYNVTLNGTIFEGSQTCLWLDDHLEWKERLCQPQEEAYKTCPKTCGKCVDTCEGQDDSTAIFFVDNGMHDCAWLSAHSSFWPTACTPDMPAYSYCKHVCHNCKV